jgi:hypothetical protein
VSDWRGTQAPPGYERAIWQQAIHLAAVFYDEVRLDRSRRREDRANRNIDPDAFMKCFPTLDDYMCGRYHQLDGSIKQDTECWKHFYDLGRKVVTKMLGMSDAQVHPNLKDAIYNSLIEDRMKQFQNEARGLKSPAIFQRQDLKTVYDA